MVITCNGDHKRAKPVGTGKHRGQGSTRRSSVRALSMGVRVSVLGSREGFLAHPDTIPDDVTGGILAGRFSVQVFLGDTVLLCRCRLDRQTCAETSSEIGFAGHAAGV